MKKHLIVIGIAVLLLAVGLSGCNEIMEDDDKSGDTETVEIMGSNIIETVNRVDKPIILDVMGDNCIITVTKETMLKEVIIMGSDCVVKVSRQHSFTSDITGENCNIEYYD